MASASGRLFRASFIAAFLLLAGLIGWGGWLVRSQAESGRDVVHTFRVLEKLEYVGALVKEGEAGQRGFVLTGRADYLAPYDLAFEGEGRVYQEIAALHALVSDNPRQQQRLDTFRDLVRRRHDELRRVIDIRRAEGLDAAILAVEANTAAETMDRLRGRLTEMESTEVALLQERSERALATTRLSQMAVAAGGVVAIGLLLLTFRTASRELRERGEAEAAVAALNRDLDLRVAARTAELEAATREAERHLERLRSLRSIDLAILGTTDLRLALRTILVETCSHLRVDAALVLLFNRTTLALEIEAGLGLRMPENEYPSLRLGEGAAGKAALERRTVALPSLAEATPLPGLSPVVKAEGFEALYAVPLISRGQLVGVLDVAHRSPLSPGPEWLEFLETLAGQAAMAIDSARSFESLQRTNLDLELAYDRTIEGWSRALDLRDQSTEGHTMRVAEATIRLARAAGFSDEDVVHVRRGAILHDIGKMGIPDAILRKPGPLTDEEWAVMRTHPQLACDWLRPIAFLRPALDIPYGHHERWDGLGYPRGLKGDQIPLAARLFSICDVADALRSERPYRAAWPEPRVREYLRAESGTRFDPEVVELYFRVFEG